MNYFQIVGYILIFVGTGISYWGSFVQSKKDDNFQNSVTKYVSEQENLNLPLVKAVDIVNPKEYESSKIILKNFGKYTATQVRLIYDLDSSPSVFSSNLITQLREINPGEEVEISLNLFSGINMLVKLPNSDQNFKKALLMDLQNFKNGSKIFIPKFHIEYFYDKKSIKSDQYYFIVEYNKGIIAFDKFLSD